MPAQARAVALLLLCFFLVPTSRARADAHDHVHHEVDLLVLELDLATLVDAARGGDPLPEGKCATFLLHAARANESALTPWLREGLASLLQPPATVLRKETLTFDSPGGNFVIEYDTDGNDAVPPADDDSDGVPDYVEWVAEAMDESWTHEIDVLGYPAPPLSGGERYFVDLRAIGGIYGFTQTLGSTPGGSFIVINADFFGFYAARPNLIGEDPDGRERGGIRVTAAHEFKHASQWIESQWSESPIGWLETDATWMEDVVYDLVNDYYNYLPGGGSPFTSPQISLTSASYEDATWQHYLLERFGMPLLLDYGDRRALRMSAEQPHFSFEAVVEADGHDWAATWNEYGVWNYLSGERATAALGFEEADRYPTATLSSVGTTLPSADGPLGLAPLAFNFHEIDNGARNSNGSFTVEFDGGPGALWVASLVLQSNAETVWRPVPLDAQGMGALSIDDRDLADFDRAALIVGNATVTSSFAQGTYGFTLSTDGTVVGTQISLARPVPNPFTPDTRARFDFTLSRTGPVTMKLYDLRGRLVRTLVDGATYGPGPQLATFDGRDDDGKFLASGVYVLRAQLAGVEKTRRVVLVK